MNPVINEFRRYASTYHHTNSLQKDIAKHLVSKIFKNCDTVLDLGCGSGAIYELVKGKCSQFVAIDGAQEMCLLHPKDEAVMIFCHDFDDENVEELWERERFDFVFSSSAIQWSKDPYALIERMKKWGDSLGIAVFTHNTFFSLHHEVGFVSLLPRVDHLTKQFKDGLYEIVNYEKSFSSTRELLEYVKKSGFNGNGDKISPTVLKKVIKENKIKTLEFEVFYGWSDEKRCCSKV